MDPDTTLIAGLVMAVFSLPAIISAFSDGRTPRVAAIVMVIAGGLVIYALNTKQGGYRMQDIPEVFFQVVAKFTN
ncbi:hypothetical protein TRP8649_00994 [Pelagimonas phthalicica]|uniref:50S ribosomal protein L35 n=1 Tax=Pelagimonas phthalicica TaxID=1037362 RepID=A0A238JAK3_9RHOB|nr:MULTISPECIES: hypothetical protein [Roseobacteraceae]MBO9466907.1 hypothetical protein [Tropicibacter sp. R15_0]TDS94576.1 hypothetical protein CLV87_1077 [Pelagimonas phthalicica]SMX26896.1 hypothetical protein TRP8649_00994 [Pelagimonas phthalicica]